MVEESVFPLSIFHHTVLLRMNFICPSTTPTSNYTAPMQIDPPVVGKKFSVKSILSISSNFPSSIDTVHSASDNRPTVKANAGKG